jgi:anti-sigma regulatory factor (Ser/Thr protein kinase)
MHGLPAGAARIEVLLVLVGNSLTMTVQDDGPPFNPLSVPAPDVTADLDQRAVGGQGVFLMRSMMDTVSYQRVGAQNQLTMTKHIER